jgi:hypothetical protein
MYKSFQFRWSFLMKNVTLILTMFFLSYVPSSFSLVRTERDLNFALDRSAVEAGTTQLATTMDGSNNFFSDHDIFKSLDLYHVSDLQNDSIIGAKYAFMVDGGIENFVKGRIFKAKEFENITKNVSVYDSSILSDRQIFFHVTKRISLYRLTSEVTYTYLDLEKDEDFVDEHQQHYAQIIKGNIPEVNASIITIHHTSQFSNFFNEAVNICLYEKMTAHKTLIYCYMISSVRRSALMTVGFVVNFEKSLKEEILYTVEKIKSLNSDNYSGGAR